MASTSETGHAKNVANLEDLISFITSYGATYNPTKGAIKLAALNALLTTAKNELASVATKTVAYNNTVNTRVIAFSTLRTLGTRLINSFMATDATLEQVKDLKTTNRKLQGTRTTKPTTPTDPNTPAPTTISTSQQSYDQLIEHFNKIIETLKAEPTYNPNENDLKVATLTTQLASLRTNNTNVSTAYTNIKNARIARDKILYKTNTGLYDVTQEVKQYIKSIYGATSPEYKQISKIKFTAQKL